MRSSTGFSAGSAWGGPRPAWGWSARTFARGIDWCWRIRPRIESDGVAHRFVLADGTYVPHGWCLLVAVGEEGRPVAWQWCDRENRHAYSRLFSRVAAPDLLVCDGNASCLNAAGDAWPGSAVQRCLVHVLRNTRRDLTSRPRTDAGRELLALARRLPRVSDGAAAAGWLSDLNGWHLRHGAFIKERTTAGADPGNPKARAGRKWWYTHERLRRAYFRLARLNRQGTLFAYVEHGGAPATTNMLEGGVNADIKRILHAHRGLGEERMRRCCEWVLYMKTADPRPERFVTPELWGRATAELARHPVARTDHYRSATAGTRNRCMGRRFRHQKGSGRTTTRDTPY
ncbi:IS1249 family transposase [Bifidobacterium tsurumiense]|uniref:IS1249 family transposase n=1 Tax=Bifidobacterium tsurumiense TaxID=356829 RepID=UPI003B75C334